MTAKHLIALWLCLLYFAIVLFSFMGYALWGSLGVFRPSDSDDAAAKIEKAVALFYGAHRQFWILFCLMLLGFLFLFGLAVWASISVRRIKSA